MTYIPQEGTKTVLERNILKHRIIDINLFTSRGDGNNVTPLLLRTSSMFDINLSTSRGDGNKITKRSLISTLVSI